MIKRGLVLLALCGGLCGMSPTAVAARGITLAQPPATYARNADHTTDPAEIPDDCNTYTWFHGEGGISTDFGDDESTVQIFLWIDGVQEATSAGANFMSGTWSGYHFRLRDPGSHTVKVEMWIDDLFGTTQKLFSNQVTVNAP